MVGIEVLLRKGLYFERSFVNPCECIHMSKVNCKLRFVHFIVLL